MDVRTVHCVRKYGICLAYNCDYGRCQAYWMATPPQMVSSCLPKVFSPSILSSPVHLSEKKITAGHP